MKITLMALLLVFWFFIGNRLGYLFTTNPHASDILQSTTYTINHFFDYLFNDFFFISFGQAGLITGGIFVIAFLMFLMYKHADSEKNYRRHEEHGSSRWAKLGEAKKLEDKEASKNILLTNTEKISLDNRHTGMNVNTMVVAGSGKGKTRFYVIPNLMQMFGNYIVTDPKGTIVNAVGNMLQTNGYKIKIFNVVNFARSMKYNPFAYINSEQDILKFVNSLISNTQGKDAKTDFWVNAEKLLFTALVGYIFYEFPDDKRNFATLIDLLDRLKASDDEEFESEIDKMFEKLEKDNSRSHFAVRQYKKFKQGAGETMKSILLSCAVRMSPFDIDAVRAVTEYDEMDFDSFPEEKTAFFVIIDDDDTTFNFLVAIMFSQLMNRLKWLADNKYGGALPIHHRFEYDEFANIGKISNFENSIATIRSREISVSVILQSLDQLKVHYKDSRETIIENCATLLYLGGTGKETPKYISELAGKETVDNRMTNESKGRNSSTSVNNTIISRYLITPDEVRRLKRNECLLFIDSHYPFKSKKYNLKKHQNYKLLSEYKSDNFFDVEQYISQLDNDDWTKEVLASAHLETYVISEDDILNVLSEYPELDLLDFSVN